MPVHSSRLSALLAAATLGAAACGGHDTTAPVDHATLHQGANPSAGGNAVAAAGLTQTVRAATSRFHSTTQATKAGYVVASPCVAAPPGGMGFHWVNGGLVDPVFEPHNPEVVLYAPDANGNLRLVAVEYVVINTGQAAPTFDGHPFDVGGVPGLPVAHWSLHVWLHRENPNGLFTPFNPAVTCPAP